MAYDQKLADRIRECIEGVENVEEKQMIGGLTFMVNGKMCIGIIKDELMCRIDPAIHHEMIEKPGCRTMDFTKRPMSGFIMVEPSAMSTQKDLGYWIGMALDFNKKAKASKKKK